MLPAMLLIFGGGVLIWDGFVNPPGGLFGAFQNILAGKPATTTTLNENTAARQANTIGTIFTPAVGEGIGGGSGATSAAVKGKGSAPGAGESKDPDKGLSDDQFLAGQSGNAVVSYARTYLGTPYKWGGRSKKGFDCAGFTHYVAAHFGINIAWYVGGQLGNAKAFSKITRKNLRPGDFIFYGVEHVAIYVGGNNVIHAPRPGTKVRIEGGMGNTPGVKQYRRLRLTKVWDNT